VIKSGVEGHGGSEADAESHLRAGIFALLLKGYSHFARRAEAKAIPLSTQFGQLLRAFANVNERARTLSRSHSREEREQFGELLAGYDRAVESHRRQQEDRADDFNLLAVMQLTHKEIRHSMVLAWLLDHDMQRLGTHAQGSLGFQLFLRELGLPSEYAQCAYWVRRELAGDESIVDIEIACRGRFLIHVENKIWSSEGMDQTDREWADLRRRALALGLDADALDSRVHAFFLTPAGSVPINSNFRAIGWNRIVRVLEAFAELAKPLDVKLFAAHYARGLRRFIVTETVAAEENNGRTTIE
jgi:hypothetical protein